MAAVSIRLPEDIAQRLNQLAVLTGRSKSFYITRAIVEQLDDLEDVYLAEQRLTDLRAGRSTAHTLADVERELDLAD